MSDDKVKETKIGEAEQADEAEMGRGGGIVQFAMKAVIIGVVFSACVIFIASYVIGNVRDSFRHVGGNAFWGNIEKQLDRAADPRSDLPPETKQKIIHDLRVIVDRWRPLLEAVQQEAAKPAGTTEQPANPAPHQ